MPNLYLHVTESSVGGEPESDDRWARHSDIVTTVSFNSVSKNATNSFWSCRYAIEVTEEVYNSDKVFLVIVRYTDGGTFGRTTGMWEVQGSFVNEQDAVKLAESIQDGSYEKNNYACWTGYFASLENVEIHCFNICQTSSGNPIIYHH